MSDSQDTLLISDPPPITVSQFNLVESLDNAKDMWYKIARAELKGTDNLISFVASCNFDIEQLCYIEEQIEKLRIGKQNDDYDRNLNEIEDQYVPEVEHDNE